MPSKTHWRRVSIPTMKVSWSAHLHRARTRGRAGLCTECGRHAVQSVRWRHPAYPRGWWGAYCTWHRVA